MITDINEIKSKINGIIGNKEEKQSIRNQINSIINSSKSTATAPRYTIEDDSINRSSDTNSIKKMAAGVVIGGAAKKIQEQEKRYKTQSVNNSNIKSEETPSSRSSINSQPITNPVRTGQRVTSRDISAMTEAQKREEEFNKGGIDATHAMIKTVLNNIQGGAMNTAGGLANVATTVTALGLKGSESLASMAGQKEAAEKIKNMYNNIIDAGKSISDKASYENKVSGYTKNPLLRTLGQVTNTVSEVASDAAIAYAMPGSASGTVIQGLSVGGRSAQEVLDENKDNVFNATITGLAKGYVSYLTERMFDANILTRGQGSSISSKIEDMIYNKVKSRFGKEFLNQTVGIIGENIEELVEDNVDNILDRLINNKETPGFFSKEWWDNTSETAKLTTISTIVMSLLGMGSGTFEEKENDIIARQAQKIIDEGGYALQYDRDNVISGFKMKPFYTTTLDQNGNIESMNLVKGKPINNVNKNVKINPVIIRNADTGAYNIIDGNTGILFDSTPYTSMIEAETLFDKKMLDLDKYSIGIINFKVDRISSEIENKANQLISDANAYIEADNNAQQVLNENPGESAFYNKNNNYSVRNIEDTLSQFDNEKQYTLEEVYDIEQDSNDKFDIYNPENKDSEAIGSIWFNVDKDNNLLIEKAIAESEDSDGDIVETITVKPNNENKYSGTEINNAIEKLVADNTISAIEGQTDIEGNIVTNKAKEKGIQGLEEYSRKEVKDIARDYIQGKLSEEGINVGINDLEIIGSRNRGDARADSDLDIVVEYSGDMREDDMFNILNEDPLEIEGIKVDINPITADKTGTLKEYLAKSKEYDKMKQKEGGNKNEEEKRSTHARQEANRINERENTTGERKIEKSDESIEKELSNSLRNYEEERNRRLGDNVKAEIISGEELSKNEKIVSKGFEEATGLKLNIYKTNKGTSEGAFFNNNFIFLKHNSMSNEKATNFKPYHEFGHWLKENKRELWNNLYKIMDSSITQNQISQYKQVLNDQTIFDNMTKAKEKDYIINEIISDYMGNWANNVENWLPFIENKQLSQEYAEFLADITLKNSEYGYNVFGSTAQQEQMYNEITNIMNNINNSKEDVLKSIENFEKATETISRQDIINIAKALKVYHKGSTYINKEMADLAGKNISPKIVNIDKYFKMFTDNEDLRKQAYDYALAELKNKEVNIKDINKVIDMAQKGLKKTFNKNQDNVKMQSANNLIDIVQEGIYLNSSNKDSNIIYHYFFAPVLTTRGKEISMITIMEDLSNDTQNNKFYYHDLRQFTNLKKNLAQAMPHNKVSNMLFEQDSLINNSISQNKKTVNETIINNKDMQKDGNNTRIEDFGEKIGGARKDLSTKRVRTPGKEVIHNYTVQQKDDGYAVYFKRRELKDGFKTQKEAEDFILAFKETIKSNMATVEKSNISDAYLIKIKNPRTLKSSYINKKFENLEEAESYAMALSMYLKEHNQNLFRPQIQKVERINPNDKNATKVTGDNIIKNFGFRGGEFGNWVKQSERQQFLNYAQDAFTDLAEALGVIPESLGQKNAMAIAFGARGKGLSAAVAHFEPAKKVINMTRLKGAGSLAHEYGHSIDNYLSREGGWTEDGMATTNSINPKLSENMKKAVDNVVDAMVYNTSKNEEEIAKKNEIFEKNRKENLQYHMNYLDEVFAGEAERYKYNRKTKKDEKIKMAVTEEQKQKYKKIKKTLLEGKLKGELERKTNFDNYKVETIYPKEIESIREMYKDIVGRKINDDTLYWLNRYGRPAKQVNEVKSESAYSKSAKELDQLMGRKTPYYSKTEEMWARAFESYVNDKLKAKGITNTYLVHSVNNDVYALFNPFPAGEERQNINKAFDNLIETMKAEGLFEDSNVLPFSDRNDVDNEGRELSKEQQEFFKDSKVRDENGNLLVMYHGTKDNFTIFKDVTGKYDSGFAGQGFYFTNSYKTAENYSNWKKGISDFVPKVMEVYLDIKNPLVLGDTPSGLKDAMKKALNVDINEKNILRITKEESKKITEALILKGYDGVLYKGTNSGEQNAMVIYPNQIKNIDNKKPTSNEDIRYSNRYDTDENNNYGFYSQLEKVIEDKMPNAANVQQIRGILNGSGIKQDEMNWIGLDDYLKAHSLEKINKQDILDYIKANQINIETIRYGTDNLEAETAPIKDDIKYHIEAIKKLLEKYHIDYEESDRDIYHYASNGLNATTIGDYMADTIKELVDLEDTEKFEKQEDGSYISSYTNGGVQWQSGITEEILESDMQELEALYEELHEAQMNLDMLEDEYMDDEDAAIYGIPKYEKYALEGGKNYQEKLYTVPTSLKDPNYIIPANEQLVGLEEYKSPHWSEKNVVAHARTQDFQDINGNKVLFIDEIQSDMHQEGRKKGYRTQEQNNKIKELEEQIKELQNKHNDIEEEYYGVYHDIRDRMIKKMDDIHNKILRNDAIFREIESILTREEQQAYTTYILDISYLIESQYSKNDFDLTDRKRLEKDIKNIMDSQATFPNISEDIINRFSSKEEFYKYTYDFIQSSLINDIKEDYKVGVHVLTESELNKFATEKERQVIKNRRTIRENFNKNIDSLNNQLNELKYGENAGRIADIFPFKKNWHEFVLRRMINDAVQNGYDEVAWTTGRQQRERYNLAKYIDYIKYQKLYNHPKDVDLGNVGEVVVEAYKEGNKVFDRYIKANELADYIGKDLAMQILNSKEGKGEISNLDESINENGNSGMYLFYDQEVPTYLNKYLKKWNSKVETITLKDADGKAESKQPGFKITEEMKQAVKEFGQPLFADRIDLEDDSAEGYTEEQKELLEEQRKERLEIAKMIKQRSFYKNIYSSDIPAEMRKTMKKNKEMYNYNPISNQTTLEKANKIIAGDYQKARANFYSMEKLTKAEDTAVGELLIRNAITKGDYAEANLLSANLAAKLTDAGQIIQAASMFKRMTPEGMLIFAQRQIEKINEELNKKYKIDKFLNKKEVKIQLTDEKVAFINGMMKEMEKWEAKKAEVTDAATMEVIERQQDIILAKIMAKIGEDIPPTRLEKLAAWRNISLLLNPKTIMRNLVSNTFFGTLENISDTLGVGLDMAVSLATGERSMLMPNLKTQAKGLRKGLNYAIEDTREGISTSLGGNKYEIKPGDVFKSNLLNKLQTASYFGVEGLDRPFMQAKYESALEMLMKLEGLKYGKDLAPEELKQEALEMAKYTTFKEKNAISDFLSKTKRTLNQGRSIGAADVIGLTYTNIPGNLTKKAIDYSPAGLYNVFKAYNNFKTKKLGGESTRQAQRQMVQSASRVLIGTGIMTASMAAFLKGILTASGDDEDDKVIALTNQENYAINVTAFLRWLTGKDTSKQNGDLYVTYSNYEPLSSMIAAATDMMSSSKSGEDPTTTVYKGLTTWINTIAELSTLSNFSSLFEYGDLGGTLTRSLAQFPSSFIPTFSKQIAQYIEPNSKSNYSDNYFEKNFINPILQRIPGLSSRLENYYDTFGEAKKNFNNSKGLARIYDVFLNTSFTSTTNMDEVKQELYDLYNSTGLTDHLPIQVNNYFTYKGEKITLTAKEKAEYQKQLGQRTAEEYKKVMNTSEYKKLSDEAKVKKLDGIKDALIKEVRGDVILEPRGLAYETKFSPTQKTISQNKQQLTLTQDMQLEYEKVAEEEYNKLKKQGLYTEEKMVNSAKTKAKQYMLKKYKNQLVKAGE